MKIVKARCGAFHVNANRKTTRHKTHVPVSASSVRILSFMLYLSLLSEPSTVKSNFSQVELPRKPIIIEEPFFPKSSRPQRVRLLLTYS